MLLRDAHVDDAPALATLGRDSFCAKFAHLYRAEDLDAFLREVYAPDVVAGEIADPQLIHQLAVTEDETLAGFIKLKYPSDYADYSDAQNPLGLGQLYTDPQRTGQGIGARLMDWALDQARKRSCDAIQLSVYSENFGAQKFYERYGFGKIADIFFMVGTHRDDEFLYELRL